MNGSKERIDLEREENDIEPYKISLENIRPSVSGDHEQWLEWFLIRSAQRTAEYKGLPEEEKRRMRKLRRREAYKKEGAKGNEDSPVVRNKKRRAA